MKKESDTPNLGERHSVIEAIKTPLGFFSLTMLVVEALIVEIPIATNGNFDKGILLYGVVGIPVLLIVLVGVAAVWKPESLWGKRYTDFDESFAERLGEDIYTALELSLANLEESERDEAYKLLRRTLLSSPSAKSRTTKKFRGILSETIIRRADLQDKWRKTKIKTDR